MEDNKSSSLDTQSLLLEIYGNTKVLQADVGHIKLDIREHVKRTAIAEARIDLNEQKINKGTMVFRFFLWTLGTVFTLIGLFLGYMKLRS